MSCKILCPLSEKNTYYQTLTVTACNPRIPFELVWKLFVVKTVCGQKHDGAFTGLGAGMDVYNAFEANIHLTGKEKDKKMKR